MSFKPYESKPITRLAHEITETDIISKQGPKLFQLKFRSGEAYNFVAHETVKTGDFIVYLNENDIYHCNRKVFAERNEGVSL